MVPQTAHGGGCWNSGRTHVALSVTPVPLTHWHTYSCTASSSPQKRRDQAPQAASCAAMLCWHQLPGPLLLLLRLLLLLLLLLAVRTSPAVQPIERGLDGEAHV